MTSKRKESCLDPPQDRSSSPKQQKQRHWADENVGCSIGIVNSGIAKVRTYEGIKNCKSPLNKKPKPNPGLFETKDMVIHHTENLQMGYNYECRYERFSEIDTSFGQLKTLIDDIEELRYAFYYFHFYPGFKQALKAILTAIEEMKDTKQNILIIHGPSGIGKSCLSQCLAYYLALAEGESHYIKLGHHVNLDHEALTESFFTRLQSSEWMVIDQVNVFNLVSEMLWRKLDSRPGSTNPLIMFTSGHYTPGEEWMSNSSVVCKIINLKVDKVAVGELKKQIGSSAVSSEVVLEVTSNYRQLIHALYSVKDDTVDKEQLMDILYSNQDYAFLDKQPHFLWLAWPELMNQLNDDQLKLDDWKLKPELVQYLGMLATDEKDSMDKKMNTILKWLDIDGDEIDGTGSGSADGYHSYRPDSYYFVMPHVSRLLTFLREIYHSNAKADIFKNCVSMFGILSTKAVTSHVQFIKGRLFEMIIDLACELSSDTKKLQGMGVDDSGEVTFQNVHHMSSASTVEELCECAWKAPFEKNPGGTLVIWCTLNVPGKSAFKGYDFAYMCVKQVEDKVKVTRLQLLQVTVSLQSKKLKESRTKMLAVLMDIKKTMLSSVKFTDDSVETVLAYVVLPGEEIKPAKNIIVLRKDEEDTINAEVVRLISVKHIEVAVQMNIKK